MADFIEFNKPLIEIDEADWPEPETIYIEPTCDPDFSEFDYYVCIRDGSILGGFSYIENARLFAQTYCDSQRKIRASE